MFYSHFTQSHGHEKSSLYYDLFDFGVLFYGHIPTLIFIQLFHHPASILTVNVDYARTDLEKNV